MSDNTHNVAIIGGGSAAIGAALGLRKDHGDGINITVFEKEPQVGGRAFTLDFAGEQIEMGGSILHSSGQYTTELMKLTGAKEGASGVQIDGKNETFGFWTDQGVPLVMKSSFLPMAFAIVRHVGLRSALRLAKSAKQLEQHWSRIYDLQRAGGVYRTPQEQLAALGLTESTKVSLREALRAEGISDKTINTIVEPIVHNMYNQDADISAFAGEVGLAGAGLSGGYLFSIEGGNWTLIKRAFDALGVRVLLNSRVTAVTKLSSNGSQSSQWEVSTGDESSTFDSVIIAAPLALADLRISIGGQERHFPIHPYQTVHTTLVAGTLSPAYFTGSSNAKLPSTLFIANSASTTIKSIGVTGYSAQHDTRIYKVFSGDHEVTDAELNEFFVSIAEVKRFVWKGAYPKLTPGIDHLPYELSPGLTYACAFETVAGSIEVEIVGGVNASRLR